MAPMSSLSPYTTSQVNHYLTHISLPQPFHPQPKGSPNIDFLAALQCHHLASIPFENLALHYSVDKNISLAPQALYDKFITGCRGGYCMEQNLLFAYMLRGRCRCETGVWREIWARRR